MPSFATADPDMKDQGVKGKSICVPATHASMVEFVHLISTHTPAPVQKGTQEKIAKKTSMIAATTLVAMVVHA
jgi:hypothetical protein